MPEHEKRISPESNNQLANPNSNALENEIKYMADLNEVPVLEKPLTLRERIAKKRQISQRLTPIPGITTDITAGADLTDQYLKEVGQSELLSPQQELTLCIMVQKGIKAELELQDLGDAGEKGDLKELIKIGNEAKTQLVESNLRLVVSIAKRYTWSGIPLLDLIQEGNIGLIRGIEDFDPERGFRLSTYATHWIRQGITRSIQNDSRVIRIPVHMDEALKKYSKAIQAFMISNNREPSPDDIEQILNEVTTNSKTFKETQHTTALKPASLDKRFKTDDDEVSFAEVLPNSSENTEEAAIENVYSLKLKAALKSQLDSLDPREREVLQMRFGMTNEFENSRKTGFTLEEVGKRLGVTRERVRQIESKALSNLRRSGNEYLLFERENRNV